ncbi:unnamed protein product, partial [Prorocentrum cordatum]
STTDGTSTLTTDGVQLTIVTDRDVDWVTTDINGDVFFSDKTNRFVGHLTYATIEMLAKARGLEHSV